MRHIIDWFRRLFKRPTEFKYPRDSLVPLYTEQFSTNLELLLKQKGRELREKETKTKNQIDEKTVETRIKFTKEEN